MKERPILFSGPMVRAILAGQKTQTRRVVKALSIDHPDSSYAAQLDFERIHGGVLESILLGGCPYGQPGDRLWVRETWRYHTDIDNRAIYRADSDDPTVVWHPSIHMPRWASRITLEITSVRVERIQDISEADAVAEGIGVYTFARGVLSDNPPDPRWKFIELWNTINAKRGYGWESNPFVWVIEFKRLEPSDATP